MLISTVGIIASNRQIGGGGGITATFQQSAVSTANSTTYTFTAQPIGSASSTRRVVVAIVRNGSQTQPLTSVTIGGVTATLDQDPNSGSNRVAIVSAVVPTGTTADVVVTLAETAARCGIGVWTLTGGSPTGQVADATSTSTLDLTTTTAVGDVVIAAVASNTATVTFTWSGADERYDQVVESGFDHSGADTVAVGTSTAISVTSSASTNRGVAAAYA